MTAIERVRVGQAEMHAVSQLNVLGVTRPMTPSVLLPSCCTTADGPERADLS